MRRLLFPLLLLALAATASAQVLTPSPQGINVQDSGTACANTGTCASWTSGVSAYATLTFQLTGTCGTCTVTFEATADNQTWFALLVTKLGTGVPATTTTTTGQYTLANVGVLGVRARLTARSTGGFNVSLTRGVASSTRLFLTSPTFTHVTATGQFRAADGSMGAPGYAFSDEAGLGFARISTGTISVAVNSVQTLRFQVDSLAPATLLDNAFDLGVDGTQRLRSGFFGTKVKAPLYVAGSTDGVSIGPCLPAAITVIGGIVTAMTGGTC